MGIALGGSSARGIVRPAAKVASRRRRRPEAPPADRLDAIEGMRGLAALYVVLSHFVSMVDWPFSQGGRTSVSPAWLRAAMAPFVNGHLAVAAFIVISGFCLQYSLFRSGDGRLSRPGRWFVRRARRILPAYYAALLLSAGVTWAVTSRWAGTQPFDTYLPLDRDTFAAHVLLVQNLSPLWMYKINGAMWSIAIEAQLYLVFPILVLSLRRAGRRATLLGTGAIALGLSLLVPGATKLYFWFAPLFVAGMVAAHLAFRPRPRWGTMPRAAAAGGIVFAFLTYGAVTGRLPLFASDLAFGGVVACVCYFMAVEPGRPTERLLSLRPLVALGGFSYSLYLIHSPVQQVVWSLKPAAFSSPETSLGWLLAIGLPVILFVSAKFARLFERPFLARRPADVKSGGAVPALPLRARGVR